MKKLLLFLFFAFFAFSWQVDAQSICTQTFTGSGQDDDPTVVTVVPGDITCNGGQTINSITLVNSAGNLGNSYCGNWYDFTLKIDGSVVIAHGCKADFDGTNVPTNFTTLEVNSNDLDAYSDGVTITFDLEINYVTPSCPAPSALTAANETSSGADLGWTENGSSTHWDLEIGTTGFSPTGTPTDNDVTANPYTWSSGDPTTTYDFYVRADCGADNTDVSSWVGPFSFTTLATCPAPTAQTESNITYTSADLGWTENGSATTWDIELGAEGFTPTGTPTQSGVTNNPYTYGSLTANTSYDWYVRSDCGGGDQSTWVGPSTFYTGYCLSTSTSSSTYTDDFTTTGGSTNISNTSSGYATNGYEDATAMSVSRYATGSVDFTAAFVGTTVGFNIWVDWNNDFDFDDTDEKVYASGSYVSSASGTITVPAGTANGNYRMRTRCDYYNSDPNACGERTRAETEDYTFTVVDPPSCPDPSALTAVNETLSGADLGWTENGSSTHWDLEIGTTGFSPTGTPTDNDVTVNPYTWSGGNSSTTYDFYVRADCGADNTDVSSWVGPYTFTTLCDAFTATYSENFDAVTTPDLPMCWSKVVDATSTYAAVETTTTNNSAPNGAKLYNSGDASATLLLITPEFSDLTSQVNQIRFYAKGDGYDLIIGTMSDPGDQSTFTSFTTLTLTSSFDEYTVSFSTYSGSDTYIAFKHGLGGTYRTIYIDDFNYEPIPSCPAPTAQTANNITTTTADLGWTTGGASAWEIVVQAAGSGAPAGSGTATTTNPYHATGLSSATDYEFYVRDFCDPDYSAWTGPFAFTTLTPPPANDECSGAIAVTVDAAGAGCPSPTTANNAGATGSEATNGTPACNNYNGGDVWYSFTAPYGGKVKVVISTNNWSTAAAAIYDGCGSSTEIDCDGVYGTGNFTLEGMTAGNIYYLRMWDYGNDDVGTVDFCLEELPCDIPTGLSASNESTTGADLSWTENGAADHWDLFIVETATGTVPDASTTPTVDDTPDNPYTWTGGAASTDYDWYVRADCGASGGNGQSDWSAKGTFTTASADAVDWCNLQFPDAATITAGGSVDVFAQVYEPGVTDAAGQGAGITAWIGYSTTDTDPSTWTDWVAATYNVDSGNNDEYKAALGAGLASGTYYYASRFKLNSGAYQYGGYSAGGGGFWDGTTYVSGVLTVNPITGDMLCDAIALTVDAAPTTSSNSNCTGETGEPNGSCWSGTTSMESIWFSFVAPNTGSVEVTTDFDTPLDDTHIAIYEVGNCNDMATLTEKGCDEDGGSTGNAWNSIAQVYGLTIGNTYYVQVDGYGANDGEFNIQVKKICPDNLSVLPANNGAVTSTASCQDGDWTHYIEAPYILLSLKLGSSGAVIPENGVTVDADGATDAQWYLNDADGFPSVAGEAGAAFMKRKWDVNASTQPSSDVGVRFYYTDDEYNAVNTVLGANGGTALTGKNAMSFYKVTTSEDPFNISPGGIAQGDYELIKHGAAAGITTWVDGTFGTENYAEFNVAGFSGGGAGTGSAGKSIPIELLSFTGYADKDANILKWTTLSEVNTSMFYVERSEFGKEWTAVAKVEASGNSLSKKDYQVADKEPVTKAFYRLRSIDRDGKYTLSRVVTIERRETGLRLNAVYPNPNNGNFVVNLTSLPGEKGQIVLINALGIKVYTKDLNTKGGRTIEKINVNQLPNGIYTLMLEQNSDIITKRVVINK